MSAADSVCPRVRHGQDCSCSAALEAKAAERCPQPHFPCETATADLRRRSQDRVTVGPPNFYDLAGWSIVEQHGKWWLESDDGLKVVELDALQIPLKVVGAIFYAGEEARAEAALVPAQDDERTGGRA